MRCAGIQEHGGAFIRPAGHATRLLRELVELCVAAGAGEDEIKAAIYAEMDKAAERGEFGGNPDNIPEEFADCSLLLDIFAGHVGLDQHAARKAKLDVLWDRKWAADSDGVLWRPMKAPSLEDSAAKAEA